MLNVTIDFPLNPLTNYSFVPFKETYKDLYAA